ncbi:hypothetical protein BGX27_002680, partial [Mortierella sp. AM989]
PNVSMKLKRGDKKAVEDALEEAMAALQIEELAEKDTFVLAQRKLKRSVTKAFASLSLQQVEYNNETGRVVIDDLIESKIKRKREEREIEGIIQGESEAELLGAPLPCRAERKEFVVAINGSETLAASGVLGLDEAGDPVVELDNEGAEEKFGMSDDTVVVEEEDAVRIIRDMAENMLLVGIVVAATAAAAEVVDVAKAEETLLLLDGGNFIIDGIELVVDDIDAVVVAPFDSVVAEKGFESVLLQH